jgi:lysophospholipase L1-like esterase
VPVSLLFPFAVMLVLGSVAVLVLRRVERPTVRRWIGRALLPLAVFSLSYLVVESVFVFGIDRSHAFDDTLIARRWLRRHVGPTNVLGFRDREPVLGRAPVAVLGDSFVWGYGIADRGDRVTERLEACLAAKGVATRVSNWAYPGLDTRDEISLLERTIRQVGAPHVLVHVYVWNDIHGEDRPDLPRRGPTDTRPERARLVRPPPPWLAFAVDGSYSINFFWHSGLMTFDPAVRRTWQDSIERYRNPRLLAEHEKDLDELRRVATKAGATYLAVGWPFHYEGPDWDEAYDWIAASMKKRKVPYLDLRKTFAGVPPADLRVWAFDPHPNPRACALAAAAIAERVEPLLRAPGP